MRYHQECLLDALKPTRWEVRWPSRLLLHGPSSVWWLENRRPRGRFVVIAFSTYYVPGSRHPRFRATVRPAVSPAGMAVEAEFDLEEELAHSFRRLRVALDFFDFPRDWIVGSAPPDGWEPPVEWLGLRWPAESGGEALWRAWNDPAAMLDHLMPALTERKRLLIACAISRRLPLAMLHARNVAAVESAERYADALCPRREMKRACKHSALPWLADLDPNEAAYRAVSELRGETNEVNAPVCDAIREVVGNPFCPVEMRREWLRNNGGAAGRVLEAIEGERRYEDLPILADALEDAGCSVASLLDHCRGPGPHLRGCWVLDLLRGRD
jgi:hypothetical protein